MRGPRRGIAWLVAPLLLSGACGSDPQTSPDGGSAEQARYAELVAASGQRLLDEKTARVTSKMSQPLPASAGGGVMTGRGRGAFDYASQSGYFTVEMTHDSFGTLTVRSIMDFPLMYMNMSEMLRRFRAGDLPPQLKPWIRMDLDAVGEELGIDLGAMMSFGRSDLGSYALYTKGMVDVERVGEEEIRNKRATLYSGTMDFHKLLEEDLPEDVRSSLETTIEMMGTSRIPLDVWVDSSGRMVRQRMEMPMPLGATGESVTSTMDMTYFGFGREVDVDLPPERKVMDFKELLELAPGGSGSQDPAPPSDAVGSSSVGDVRA